MKELFKIAAVFIFIFLWNGLSAQLHDVYSGKSIEVEHHSIKFTPKIKYVTTELDYTCLHINGEPTSKTAVVNYKILELFKSYLLSEEKFLPVYKEMGKRVDQFNKMAGLLNNDEYRDNSADKLSAKLSDMNCNEVSYVSNLLFFSVNFNFWLEMGNNEGIEINISEYYHVNLTNAEITKLDFEWNESEKERIMAKIKDELNLDYNVALTKYHYEDIKELQKIRKIETNDSLSFETGSFSSGIFETDKSSKIKIEEADFYWMGWGLMVSFQKFTESSGIYSGNPFEIFIPFDKAKAILENVPSFAFLKKLEVPTTSLKDFNLTQCSSDAIDIYDPREITDLIHDNKFEETAKRVRVNYYQVMKDSSRHNLTSWEHDFTREGKLLKTTRFDEKGEISSRVENLYSNNGKLLLNADFDKNGSTNESEEYSYDKNGNLAQVIYKNDNESFVYRYFYNGNYVYQMVRYYIKDGSNDHFSKNYYDGKELKMDDQTYFLNDVGKITGNKSEKYTMYQLQLSRNEKNQLVEVHRENDRYNRFYQYDSQGRIEFITNFESSRIGKSIQYSYDGIFPFPKKMESFDPTGGQDTRLVQEYSWELY